MPQTQPRACQVSPQRSSASRSVVFSASRVSARRRGAPSRSSGPVCVQRPVICSGLLEYRALLPKALLTGVRRSCRCFEISRVKACCLQAARPPPHPPRKLENIFVTPAACEAAQSFEKDGVNGRLLRAGIESRKRASLHIKLWCGAATNPPYPRLGAQRGAPDKEVPCH